jgi:hypothetical protein
MNMKQWQNENRQQNAELTSRKLIPVPLFFTIEFAKYMLGVKSGLERIRTREFARHLSKIYSQTYV